MSDPRTELRRYLSLGRDAAFVWDDGCETVSAGADAGGETVAFRGEIQFVLRSLTEQGLAPPFSFVLLEFTMMRALVRGDRRAFPVGVRDLDPGLWGEPYAVAIAVVHRIEHSSFAPAPERAAVLHDALQDGLPREGLTVEVGEGRFQPRLSDAGEIRQPIDVEAMERRIRAGVEEEVGPAPLEVDLEVDDATRVRRLLDDLEGDAELGGVARLARDLMAALRIPSPGAQEQDLPIGGYADVANRGEIDRLLLSELAQDDEVLASRLVLGEALYLQREVPRERPRLDRTLLIDNGIRTWGVARLFATAAALAVAAQTDRGASLRALRADGDDRHAIDLTDRVGLQRHMGSLTADPHPARALARLVGEQADDAQNVLVTTRAALRDPALGSVLDRCTGWTVVAVDADGRVELVERNTRGTRLLSSARFDLDRIVAKPAARERPRRADRSPSPLPAYVRHLPSPLRPTFAPERARVVEHARGEFILTRDRRVMFWKRDEWNLDARARANAYEVAVLPRGDVLAFQAAQRGVFAAIYGHRDARLTTAWVADDAVPVLRHHGVERPVWIGCSGDRCVVRTRSDTFVADSDGLRLGSSRRVPACTVPPMREPGVRLRAGASRLTRVRALRITALPQQQPGELALVGHVTWHFAMNGSVGPAFLTDEMRHPYVIDQEFMLRSEATHPFRPVVSDHPAARFLSEIRWSDGSVAWMDRRGLLHLRSGDRTEGDVSILLEIEHPVGAWCTEGWQEGPGRAHLEPIHERGSPGEARLCAWIHRFVLRVSEAEVVA
ncbi:MAG: hypothetical protein AAGB93_00250 [Planctomycetota bacterium]